MSGRTFRENDHFIVAIGASAGGLEAIHEFFDNMPDGGNISFIIIQHLSPDYKSLLVELVSRHTHMKVFEAEDNLPVRKNCVYVIPNNKFITLRNNRLVLSEKDGLAVPNNAIDVFMHTLAEEKKHAAVAVILSGTGTDGTRGIATVKREGGMVIVQEPATAKFNGMPNSAIASGQVDYVLTPDQMPAQIARYMEDSEFPGEDSISEEQMQKIFQKIHEVADMDFYFYKTPTVTRRIFHRMKKGNFETVDAYLRFLDEDDDEARLLGKDFLINVTRFFRDPEAYDFIREQVFPALLQGRAETEEIKLWVCACSTGEEAYSLAIVLDEVLQHYGRSTQRVKIFATDLDNANIQVASKGFYSRNVGADIGPERLKRYFIAQQDGYLVHPRIRKQIIFSVHNVISDPPFIRNDFVSCRNMLIYMNSALQERVYSVLLFAVRQGGYIFLGSTENPNSIQGHLAEASARFKVFRKVSEGRNNPYLPELSRKPDSGQPAVKHAGRRAKGGLLDDLSGTLLDDFNIVAFYVDRNFEICDAVGDFESILTVPRRVLKLNLLKMLPVHVSGIVAGEIRAAWKSNEKRILRDIPFRHPNADLVVRVVVKPEQPSDGLPYTLVVMQYASPAHAPDSPTVPVSAAPPEADDYILSLEEELNETRLTLQHTIEDLETANEELQSSNEELLSANEELQSSNEELQSLNEELHTLNTEHQMKIRELIVLNDDLNNYFRSSNIGQIFLDENLAIRKFTPASSDLINVIDSDVGRPITHISTNFKYNGFIHDLEAVLATKEPVEKEVELHSGMNVLLRVMPYVTGEKKNAGLIISFFDVTAVTRLNNIMRGVFNASRNSILALQAVRGQGNDIADFLVLTANETAGRLIGKDLDNIKGSLVRKNGQAPFLSSMFGHLVKVVDHDVVMHTDFYYEPERLWLEASAVKMMDGLVVTLTDITEKKQSEERLKRNYSELIKTREHLKDLNAALEAKVTERTQLLSASEERFRLVARATNDAIWDWDLVNNRIWFSDAFYIKFGYPVQEDAPREMWFEKIHPSERAEVKEDMFRAINSREKQWSREFRFRKENGEYANILERGYIMQDDFNMPYRMVGSMLDLTELKKAQDLIAYNVAQRRFLAESMPLIVWTADAVGKVNFLNKQFQSYTGIRQEEALGEGWLKAVHPEDLPRLRAQWQAAVESKRNFQTEIRLQVSGSGYHWNILRAKVSGDEQDRMVNWVITIIDIHDQKLHHELLEQKVEERTKELLRINHALEVSNHDLQQFASVASHDLQEPLRKIHLYASMVHDRFSGAIGSASGYLQKILQSSVRMKSIITNILNYSKLSADHLTFEKTDLNKMMHEIIEDLEIAISEKQATFDIGALPVVDTIPGQIRQVFQNMIVNSLKFSRSGIPPHILISGERVRSMDFNSPDDRDGAFLRIIFADNGIGFNEKFAQQVFVLFQRLHSKDAFEGTGIGLAIAKKIIEKHNGIIEAHGKEGEGATFTIIIPVRQN